MGQFLLYLAMALIVAVIVFGVMAVFNGKDAGLVPVEPDGRAVPLPGDRPLAEGDLIHARFDVVWRGYRMAQVDQALQRSAYDIGYKSELINVLEAEVAALREGRFADADIFRQARLSAVAPDAEDLPGEVPSADTAVTAAATPTTAMSAAAGEPVAPEVAPGVLAEPAAAAAPTVAVAPTGDDPAEPAAEAAPTVGDDAPLAQDEAAAAEPR